VQLNPVQQTQIEALSSVLDKLSKNDGNFASSLIQNFYRYGNLSPKQLTWVDTLQQRATQPAPVAQIQVNFQKIQDLFDVAAKKLRRVKVKLQTTQGQPVAFSRAGATSKYAGQILITDGGPFGNNKFLAAWMSPASSLPPAVPPKKCVTWCKSLQMTHLLPQDAMDVSLVVAVFAIMV
jgi:hypothetical protein